MVLKKLVNWNRINKNRKKGQDLKMKEFENNQSTMPWHVYSNGQPQSYSDHVKHFSWVHFFVKGKILIPFLLFFQWLIGKKIDKPIPDFWYNQNFKSFDAAFEKSLFEWYKYFIVNLSKKKVDASGMTRNFPSDEEIQVLVEKNYGCKLLRFMKQFILLIALNDTAYREFLNILLFNITLGVQKDYGEKGCVDHPLYVSRNISDVNYFLTGQVVVNNRNRKK